MARDLDDAAREGGMEYENLAKRTQSREEEGESAEYENLAKRTQSPNAAGGNSWDRENFDQTNPIRRRAFAEGGGRWARSRGWRP